jgi:predicted transcriptional regulator
MSQVLETESRVASGRRSAFEVRMAVLRVAAEGAAKPTHMMYRSNTSWTILQRNIDALLAAGFIQKFGELPRVEYSITERGMKVLSDYLELVYKTTGAQAARGVD